MMNKNWTPQSPFTFCLIFSLMQELNINLYNYLKNVMFFNFILVCLWSLPLPLLVVRTSQKWHSTGGRVSMSAGQKWVKVFPTLLLLIIKEFMFGILLECLFCLFCLYFFLPPPLKCLHYRTNSSYAPDTISQFGILMILKKFGS